MKCTVLSGLGDLHEDDAKKSDDINVQAACYALWAFTWQPWRHAAQEDNPGFCLENSLHFVFARLNREQIKSSISAWVPDADVAEALISKCFAYWWNCCHGVWSHCAQITWRRQEDASGFIWITTTLTRQNAISSGHSSMKTTTTSMMFLDQDNNGDKMPSEVCTNFSRLSPSAINIYNTTSTKILCHLPGTFSWHICKSNVCLQFMHSDLSSLRHVLTIAAHDFTSNSSLRAV